MELNGSIKSFNLHKGWGFVDYNGEDIFLHKKNLNGFCPSKGDLVRFTKGQTAKGPVAENVKVVSPFEETSYYGSIKSYNFWKGYGFISSKAFPDKDVFVFWSELPGGFGPEGSPCKFRVSMDEKGPAAKKVMLLGAAGKQIWQMKWMLGYGYRGFGGFGKCQWEPCKADLQEKLFQKVKDMKQQQEEAATKIQAIRRGNEARKQAVPELKAKLKAITKMQAVYRGQVDRKKAKDMKVQQEEAATVVKGRVATMPFTTAAHEEVEKTEELSKDIMRRMEQLQQRMEETQAQLHRQIQQEAAMKCAMTNLYRCRTKREFKVLLAKLHPDKCSEYPELAHAIFINVKEIGSKIWGP